MLEDDEQRKDDCGQGEWDRREDRREAELRRVGQRVHQKEQAARHGERARQV